MEDMKLLSELCNMKLHEEISLRDNNYIYNNYILRVPGGWIYFINGDSTFVPFSNHI